MTQTITESKLKSGTLTLDSKAFACQATNVRLTPTHNTTTAGDDIAETLCGATTTPSEEETVTTTWTLNIDAIQDFTQADGFVRFCLDNNGTVKDFSWKPNATGPTMSGRVRILAVEIGGEINKRLSTSAALPVIGDVTTTAATTLKAPFKVVDQAAAQTQAPVV